MSTESACVFSFAFALVLAVWQFGCRLLPQYVALDEKPAGCFHSPVRSVDLFKRYLSLLNSRLSLYGGNLVLVYRYRSVIFQSECGLVTLLKRPWFKNGIVLRDKPISNDPMIEFNVRFGLKKSYDFRDHAWFFKMASISSTFFSRNENLRISSAMGQNHLVFDGGTHPWVFGRGLGRINPFCPCYIPL